MTQLLVIGSAPIVLADGITDKILDSKLFGWHSGLLPVPPPGNFTYGVDGVRIRVWGQDGVGFLRDGDCVGASRRGVRFGSRVGSLRSMGGFVFSMKLA